MIFDISSDGSEIFLGNQAKKYYFYIYIIFSNKDGTLISYKILNGVVNSYFNAHDDCLNSVSFINDDKKEYLVTSSGQRTFNISGLNSNDESSDSSISGDLEEKQIIHQQTNTTSKNNCIIFWKF